MAEAFPKTQPKETDQRAPDYIQAVENSIRKPPLGYVVNSHHIKYTYRLEEEIKIYDPLIDSLECALSKLVIVIVIARNWTLPLGISGPILQCFLRLLGEIGRQLI